MSSRARFSDRTWRNDSQVRLANSEQCIDRIFSLERSRWFSLSRRTSSLSISFRENGRARSINRACGRQAQISIAHNLSHTPPLVSSSSVPASMMKRLFVVGGRPRRRAFVRARQASRASRGQAEACGACAGSRREPVAATTTALGKASRLKRVASAARFGVIFWSVSKPHVVLPPPAFRVNLFARVCRREPISRRQRNARARVRTSQPSVRTRFSAQLSFYFSAGKNNEKKKTLSREDDLRKIT